MHRLRPLPLLTVLGLALLLAYPALAHKVIVFALVEGDEIVAEASFPGGKPVIDTGVSLQDAKTGDVLAQGRTDAQGIWRSPLPAVAPSDGLLVVLDAGEGHRAQWRIEPDEYLQGAPAQPAAPAPAASATQEPTPEPAGQVHELDAARLQELAAAAAAEAVRSELAPLKRQLAQSLAADEPDLRDILGGVGYLIGLAGLFAYARSRKS